GLVVAASGCTLKGLTVKGFRYGVWVSGSGNFICSNYFSHNVQTGLILLGNSNTADSNHMIANGEGGVGIGNSSGNMITNITVTGNGFTFDPADGDGGGIFIINLGVATTHNTVKLNTITGNFQGVAVVGGAQSNEVTDNTIANNEFSGV